MNFTLTGRMVVNFQSFGHLITPAVRRRSFTSTSAQRPFRGAPGLTAVRAERGHAAPLARGAAGIPAAPPRVVVEAPGRAGWPGRARVPAGGRRGDHGRAGPGSGAGLHILYMCGINSMCTSSSPGCPGRPCTSRLSIRSVRPSGPATCPPGPRCPRCANSRGTSRSPSAAVRVCSK